MSLPVHVYAQKESLATIKHISTLFTLATRYNKGEVSRGDRGGNT